MSSFRDPLFYDPENQQKLCIEAGSRLIQSVVFDRDDGECGFEVFRIEQQDTGEFLVSYSDLVFNPDSPDANGVIIRSRHTIADKNSAMEEFDLLCEEGEVVFDDVYLAFKDDLLYGELYENNLFGWGAEDGFEGWYEGFCC